jgi:hypothetical protein
VSSTVIFWTQLNCRRKSYSNKATLLLCWSHRNKNSTVVITIWFTGTKYPYLKWQWIFYFLRRCFLPSITAKTSTRLDCIYEQHGECCIRSRNCFPLAPAPKFTLVFLLGPCCSSSWFFCVVLLCVLTFWVPCCDVRYDFRINSIFGSSLSPVVCRRVHVLFTLFVFVCA